MEEKLAKKWTKMGQFFKFSAVNLEHVALTEYAFYLFPYIEQKPSSQQIFDIKPTNYTISKNCTLKILVSLNCSEFAVRIRLDGSFSLK